MTNPLEQTDPNEYVDIRTLTLSALGLLISSIGYAAGRSGNYSHVAVEIFFVGLVLSFSPLCYSVLRGRKVAKLPTLKWLGAILFLSVFFLNPILPEGFDELLHQTTLWQISYFHTLNVSNSLLPISPNYPGLESATLFIRSFTGLPFNASIFLVLLFARLLLIDGIFRFVNCVTSNETMSAVAVLAYIGSPQFYSFNAGYSYETLAIALAAQSVSLAVCAARRGLAKKAYFLPLLLTMATIVTHHIVGFVTVGALLFLYLYLLIAKRSQSPRGLGVLVFLSAVFLALWTSISFHQLYTYLQPIFSSALRSLGSLFGHNASQRELFHGASGIATPLPEEIIMLLAAGLWCLLIAYSIYSRPWRQDGVISKKYFIPIVAIAVLFPFTLVARLAPLTAEVAGRSTTFVFFAIAVLVGAASLKLVKNKLLACIGMTLLFVGSMMLGSGPDWSYVTGPYIVGGDNRSIGQPSMDAATWASENLPITSHIAADRDNGALMAAVGHLRPVTAISGSLNVAPLYYSKSITSSDISLILKAKIRFLVIDTRLERGAPAFGNYFEPTSSVKEATLTKKELSKFQGVPGFELIYHNRYISIYDLSSISGLPTLNENSGTTLTIGDYGGGISWGTFILFAAALIMALLAGKLKDKLAYLMSLFVLGGMLLVPAFGLPKIIFQVALAITTFGLYVVTVRGGIEVEISKKLRLAVRFLVPALIIAVSAVISIVSALTMFSTSSWHFGLFG